MNAQEKVLHCYNLVAGDYATDRWDELTKKHLDQLLLKDFAANNKNKGTCADFGCGPGQTTRFLYDNGLENITGIDLSPEMIATARKLSPQIKFETGDLLNIAYEQEYFGSVLAFYAIVHFTKEQIRTCFEEINRVLKTGGDFLLSFHAGDETVHFDKVHDKDVDIDLFFLKTDELVTLLRETNFTITDVIERHPYDGVEYASRRAYICCKKTAQL